MLEHKKIQNLSDYFVELGTAGGRKVFISTVSTDILKKSANL